MRKFEIIAPLLSPGLEAADKRRLRSEIIVRHKISERTLRRYLCEYRRKGYDGLVKRPHSRKGSSKIPEDILEKAIEIRRELPGRSVQRILTILEGEGVIAHGAIPKSTLSRQLLQHGCGATQVKREAKHTPVAKRFQKESRNALWQADIKYGPFIPAPNGRKLRTYMLAFIDDATRMIMHAEFYDTQRLPILEDAFRKALLKFGRPLAVYVDNGKIFISKWFRLACARLQVNHYRTQPYSPASKGKIEKFNSFIDTFLEELTLEPPLTLDALNQKFRVWLDEGYIHKPHDSLSGKTPYDAYQHNPAKVRFVSQKECHDLFLWEETHSVDNTGCVKLHGVLYEAGAALARKKVDIRFDPFDLSSVEIWADGQRVRCASPLVIGEFVPKAQIQADLTQHSPKPTHSRLLAVYERQNAQRDLKRNGAISFRNIEEDSHV